MRDQQSTLDLAPRPAFLSDDPETVLRFAVDAIEAGSKCALATLVEIRGGAFRALGAQMAVREDGFFCGFVSGGCTEAAIAAEALATIRCGSDRYLRLGQGSEFFDIQLPCGGGLTVSIHCVREVRVLVGVLLNLSRRQRVGLVYDPGTSGLKICRDGGEPRWEDGKFVRPYRPRPRILVIGNSIETATLQKLANAANYESVLWDQGPGDLVVDSDTAIAVLHHDLDRELKLLPEALRSDAFYIGALGSSRTHRLRCDALKERGFADRDIARIKAPIGLLPKSRDSVTLAISVLADIAVSYSTALYPPFLKSTCCE